MKTMIAIRNPKAGGMGNGDSVARISNYLDFRDVSLCVMDTEHAGHATQIAEEFYNSGHREFLCMGGDGTLFEMINGFFKNKPHSNDVHLAVIPTGTGNSFLKDFSTSVNHTLESIIQDRTQPSDIIEVKHAGGTLYFINIFSFGFTSQVGMLRNKYFSHVGHAGYILAVLFKLFNLRPETYRFKLDQQKQTETSSVFVSINNTRFTGGNMMMAPAALPGDGLVDVINAKTMGPMKLLQAFPKIFKGTHVQLPEVESSKAQSIEFDFDSAIPVMIDGELLTIQPQSMRVIPKAIQIYA